MRLNLKPKELSNRQCIRNPMQNNKHIFILLIGLLFFPNLSSSQIGVNKTPDDDLGNVEDEYQEYFFEALKQKGIENYNRAVEALQKCLSLNSKKPVVYFELGKNYNTLKNYVEAERVLKKAISMQPDNVWFLDELYETYYQQNDLEKAVTTLKELIKYHPDYKEDLASIYTTKGDYTKALQLLDELDAEFGTSPSRVDIRNTIYNASGNAAERITYLEQQVKNNPRNEENHLKLIYRYSESGEKEKAYKTAQNLLNTIPNSELVHLALYKFHLDDGKPQEAIQSIKKVLSSIDINTDSKSKVIKDFTNFVAKNPEYEADLLDIINAIVADKDQQTLTNLGQYYRNTGDKSKALANYKEALKQNPNDFKLIKEVLLLQLETNNFNAVIAESESAIELYPVQPILYLVNGVAQNKLGNYDNAVENLELGLDFLVENPTMEADFYSELSIAYKGLNNINKSNTFANKAKSLKAQQ